MRDVCTTTDNDKYMTHELGAAVSGCTLSYVAQARGPSRGWQTPVAQVSATTSTAWPESKPAPGKSEQGFAAHLLLTNSRAQPNFL